MECKIGRTSPITNKILEIRLYDECCPFKIACPYGLIGMCQNKLKTKWVKP